MKIFRIPRHLRHFLLNPRLKSPHSRLWLWKNFHFPSFFFLFNHEKKNGYGDAHFWLQQTLFLNWITFLHDIVVKLHLINMCRTNFSLNLYISFNSIQLECKAFWLITNQTKRLECTFKLYVIFLKLMYLHINMMRLNK